MAIATAIIAGTAAIGAGLQVYDYIKNADLRRIQNEVMTESAAFNKDLLRRARGKFTSAELAQIQQANAPALRAISGNVTARLGDSPAGASIIAQAQQQTVFNAQQQATAGALGLRGGGSGTMPQPNTLFKSLGEIAAAYKMLKNMNTRGSDSVEAQYDPTIENAIDIINKNMSGQGIRAGDETMNQQRQTGARFASGLLEDLAAGVNAFLQAKVKYRQSEDANARQEALPCNAAAGLRTARPNARI